VLLAQKEKLRKSVQLLEQRQAELEEQRRQTEREHKAIAPTIAKAIRGAFDKARADALETLGDVVVFKTLMDELINPPAPLLLGTTLPQPRPADLRDGASIVRSSIAAGRPMAETLRALGVTPKAARAIEAAGAMASECGLMLIVDGVAARVAAEAWLSEGEKPGTVLECGFGETDDRVVRSALDDDPVALAILDANLSPFDIYARPLVDAVLRRLAGIHDRAFKTRVLMSMVDGTAALPLPAVAESVSLRVYLDRIPVFLQEGDAVAWLEEIEDTEEPVQWFVQLWKPARTKVLNYLRALPIEDAALILSALEVIQS
jgi:hypothetical protein